MQSWLDFVRGDCFLANLRAPESTSSSRCMVLSSIMNYIKAQSQSNTTVHWEYTTFQRGQKAFICNPNFYCAFHLTERERCLQTLCEEYQPISQCPTSLPGDLNNQLSVALSLSQYLFERCVPQPAGRRGSLTDTFSCLLFDAVDCEIKRLVWLRRRRSAICDQSTITPIRYSRSRHVSRQCDEAEMGCCANTRDTHKRSTFRHETGDGRVTLFDSDFDHKKKRKKNVWWK